MAAYHVTVLEIGKKAVGGDFYFGDFVPSKESFPNPFSMTLLRGEGKNILIDTGIDTADETKRTIIAAAGVGNVHGPGEVLSTVGLRCADIDAVILTHAHFDHAGALDCYPNARFYLQRGELEGWRELAAHPKYAGLHIFSMDMKDIARLGELEQSGRLTLLEGDAELFPGIRVVNMGMGHSFALQMVQVETIRGWMLHASDACNRPENLTGTKLFPFYLPNMKFGVGSPLDVVRGYDRILAFIDGDLDRLIMTHDDCRRERFSWKTGPLGLDIFEIC